MDPGRVLRHAMDQAEKMILKQPCTHKIGMCRCPYERFMYYQDAVDPPWQPWLLCLLASTSTREGAWMLEASLISHFEITGLNMHNNYNWTIGSDPRRESHKDGAEVHAEHYVYLALHPALITSYHLTAASAPELPAGEHFGDLFDAIDLPAASAHPPLEVIRANPPVDPDILHRCILLTERCCCPYDRHVTLVDLLEAAAEYLDKDDQFAAFAIASKLRRNPHFDWAELIG